METAPNNRVTVVDIDISFFRLVAFFVKASLAAIPAAIIVALVLMLIGLLVRAIFGIGGFNWWGMGMHTL
ncbi:MAG: hypothetical protein JWN93_203 [Hyphomicrobiales bacterium]|nr:hypothetical protein [Hyphomicrobiales bacterium]